MPEKKTVKRIIHYYELNFIFHQDFKASDGDQCREFFALIKQLASTRSNIRYQPFGEKALFLQDVTIKPSDKVITGKLRCVRKDLLPEIMDTNTDVARGIETKEQEGVVETTHFIIDFSRPKKRLAIEHNQFGARITDLMYYLDRIGTAKKATTKITCAPVVRDELKGIKDRINRIAKFIVKVHKDNIEGIQGMDKKLYSALLAAEDHFNSEYVELSLKFDYKKRANTKEVNTTTNNLINSLLRDKTKAEIFSTLEVRAEDTEKNNRLEMFDLLVDKVKHELTVERKEKFRTVISNDIFPKMQTALHSLR